MLTTRVMQVRLKYGCHEEEQGGVYYCNWVRFLRCGPDPNLRAYVGRGGDIVFETVRDVAPRDELRACLGDEPDLPRHVLSAHYRIAMGAALEGSPLDLSQSHDVELEHPAASTTPNSSESEDRPSSFSSGSLSPRIEHTMSPCAGEKPHVCEVCGKGFSTSSSLNTHRRIHSGEKPHQCQVCGKRFTASSNLYYHRMTHIKQYHIVNLLLIYLSLVHVVEAMIIKVGSLRLLLLLYLHMNVLKWTKLCLQEKPHKCSLCSKSFPTPGDLKSHMYVHNGSWPFRCHICNRGFSKHTNLKNHLFLHTDDSQEKCIKCLKLFPVASHMLTHGYCNLCYVSGNGIALTTKTDSSPKKEDDSSMFMPDDKEVHPLFFNVLDHMMLRYRQAGLLAGNPLSPMLLGNHPLGPSSTSLLPQKT
ncbi:hypothetical protein LAZ67_8002962 [Cordylochernes scorpioides]|uniref:C2H2-type domain-containing protein n=1 Tax=Cordylochernes scorpioides TaxID=51811 RepID=A0ABY6KRB9_9ARAC|nr:hypothetical protein LAZ67_8002962 [Cordylochernes scorpioides]